MKPEITNVFTKDDILNRLIPTTQPGGCWTLRLKPRSDGYVYICKSHKGRAHNYFAHRIAWHLWNGELPTDKSCVLHRCDNRQCCNPNHLFTGSVADNNNDRTNKGRSAKGTKQGHSKLTEEQVVEIRERYEGGESMWVLQHEYPVGLSAIRNIIQRKTWKHL